MNNSAAKVGEIFREAGTAFTKLSEMTMMLQPTDDAPSGSKWSDEEVEMLRGCVNRFAVELNKISQHIKNRTMRPQKRLLEMDSGTINDVSRSPPRQEEIVAQLIQPKLLYEWEQPQISTPLLQHEDMREELKTKKTQDSTQLKSKKQKTVDVSDLLRFNPRIVPPTPPAIIMEEDTISQQAPSEIKNDNGCKETFCRSIIASLIYVLDPKYSNKTFGGSPDDTCSLGTLHAELLHNDNQDADIEGFDINNRSIVTKKGHFTWRQATKTWECNNIDSEKRQILHTTPNANLSVQVPVDTACNILPAYNEKSLLDAIQYRSQQTVDPVPGAFTSFLPNFNGPFSPISVTTQSLSLNSQDEVIENSVLQDNEDKKLSPFGPFSLFRSKLPTTNDIYNPSTVQGNENIGIENSVKQDNEDKKLRPLGPFSLLRNMLSSTDNINKPSTYFGQDNENSIFDKNEQDEEQPQMAKNVIPDLFSSIINNNCPNFKSIIKSQSGFFGNFLEKDKPLVESVDHPLKSAQVCVQSPSDHKGYFSTIGANKDKHFPSSAFFTRGTGSKSQVSSRRRGRGRSATQGPADFSTPTAGPSQGQAKSRARKKRRNSDELDYVPKKRKKAIIVTTPGPVTRSQKKKELNNSN